jgi:uncharacterized membrane-anchored protein YhcB (DUF1043 family)
LKTILKEEKKNVVAKIENRKGRLSQEEPNTSQVKMTMEELVKQERIKTQEKMAKMKKDMEAQRQELRERELQQEAMMRSLEKMNQDLQEKSQGMLKKEPGAAQGLIPQCHCHRPAEKLVVKKDCARRGRVFWKCEQRECDFFLWQPRDSDAMSIGSYTMVTSSAATQVSKSPRRSSEDAPQRAAEIVTISDGDGDL